MLKITATLVLSVLIVSAKGQNNSDSAIIKTSSGIIADAATLQLVSSQFSFTEGPAVDKKGNIFFTDQPNDKIWKYDTDGKLSVVARGL